jgi:hypothetical protein
MEPSTMNTPTKAGTAGGTLLVVLLHIHSDDLIKTAVLAAVGATVSYSVSMILKLIVDRIKRK